jgi:hypothetical protein
MTAVNTEGTGLAPVLFDNVPAELREHPQWLLWRLEHRDGKATKVPYSVDGQRASSTDPTTWTTFEHAAACCDDEFGLGFVFTADDPFTGIDFDTCLSKTGLHLAVKGMVQWLDSYCEVSPSRTGVKVIVRATKPARHARCATSATGWGGKFECYDRGRFFTVTGWRFDHLPAEPMPRQEQLEDVLDFVFPTIDEQANGDREHRVLRADVRLSDEEVLERAFRARPELERLYAGEILNGTHSEADIALVGGLAFWTGPDPVQLDRLFRGSGLMRPKWDSRRGASTYGAITIGNAIDCRTEFYREGSAPEAKRKPDRPVDDLIIVRYSTDIGMRSIRYFEKPLWQLSAFQVLGGAKGSGKGTYWAGLSSRMTQENMNVLIVSTEDSAEVDVKPRLVAAGADLDRVFGIQRHLRLPDDIPGLRNLATQLAVKLIIIDPVANHIGNTNSNSDVEVRHAIAPLNKLADELDCLIVGVRHPGKDRSRGALASILGSTAWVDTPRAVVMIAVDDEDPQLRHIQCVAGNRSLNGAGRMFRIDAVPVDGLDEPITLAVELGESKKSVDVLLASRPQEESKSAMAKEMILDYLEGRPGRMEESDRLDAYVANQTGLAVKTIKNLRGDLNDQGLVRSTPDKDPVTNEILQWNVVRTLAPRP